MTDHTLPAENPSPPMRKLFPLLWFLVGLQFIGYLSLWVQFHVVPNSINYQYTQNLVPTGWYGPGTAYSNWVARHAFLQHRLDTPAVRTTLIGGGLTLACAGYWGTLILVKRTALTLSLRSTVLLTALIGLPMLLLPQLLSSDIWGYILYGRVAVLHGGNPLVNAPATYPQDPFLHRMFWKNTPSLYGPVWVIVSIVLTRLSECCGGNPTVYLVFFKGFIFLAHLGNTAVIRRLLQSLRPGNVTSGVLLYAWNPLCIVEFCGSGHNDCFMLLLLLIGIWCVVAGRRNAAVGCIAAAGLTKLPGLLGLPAYFLWNARRNPGKGWATILWQATLATAVSIALYAPFWEGPATFDGILHAPNLRLLSHSLASGIDNLIEARLARGQPIDHGVNYVPPPHSVPARVRGAIRAGSMICFLSCYVPVSLRRIRHVDDWLDQLVSINLIYLVFAAYQFNIWYATWLVPLLALRRRPSPLLVVASLVLLSFYLPTVHSGLAVIYLLPLLLALLRRLPRIFGSLPTTDAP